jgi:hypothetical protein
MPGSLVPGSLLASLESVRLALITRLLISGLRPTLIFLILTGNEIFTPSLRSRFA